MLTQYEVLCCIQSNNVLDAVDLGKLEKDYTRHMPVKASILRMLLKTFSGSDTVYTT